EEGSIPTVAENLEVALQALKDDHDFLLKGDVFTKDMLDAFIELKTEEVRRLNTTVHPVEFDMYYSL
ncbi:MAG TPA: glutamine synthetase, partial [Psychrobacter sp.]|nr:glutamine synthetase [Psychrobacter sp.]